MLTGNSLRATFESLELRRLLTTTAPAYLVPTASGVETIPLLTVGESVPQTDNPSTPYRMVGIPDGMGAYDNGDGTFTVLVNHELSATAGVVRDHGSIGSFVAKYVIEKSTGNVISGDDLIKQVHLYDPATGTYVAATTAFNRLCSADLPDETAFYNAATGLGTPLRLFMNGEESDFGRAFAHVVATGESYELPAFGKFAFENVVASPYAQDKTIVAGLDDSSRNFASEGATDPSEVYFYIGTKQRTGSVIDRAGLTNGLLTGVKVAGSVDESTVVSGDTFTLHAFSDARAKTAAELQAESNAAAVTQFRRVEDGAWDTTDPSIFYFVTTDRFGGATRLWKLDFVDITKPELGGTISIVIDSPAGVPGEMFDNMAVNADGNVLLQEDPGNNAYLAKIHQYNVSTGDLVTIAQHNPALFDPAYTGADANFKTRDEESSGIIDLSKIMGPGFYIAGVQAHLNLADPELVQDGQLLLINTNAPKSSIVDGVLTIGGTPNNDQIAVDRNGGNIEVRVNDRLLGSYKQNTVDTLFIDASAGDDTVMVDRGVKAPAILLGDLGNDVLVSSESARSILIGGFGADRLVGSKQQDVLVGDQVDASKQTLIEALNIFSSGGKFSSRASAVEAIFSSRLIDDGENDTVLSGKGDDLLL